MATAIQAPDPPAERLRRVMSRGERAALRLLLASLKQDDEGIVTAAALADDHGMSRSTFTLALRLAEAAGVLEVGSLGHKGTHVVILDRPALEEAIR